MRGPLIAIRRGSTLIELAVVLTVLAVVGGALLVVPGASGRNPHGVDAVQRRLSEARRSAIREGNPVLVHVRLSSDGHITIMDSAEPGTSERCILALPDGGVIADSGVAIDRISGSLRHRSGK